MPKYASFLQLVKGCNLVVPGETATRHWEPISAEHAITERELTKFILRDDNGKRRVFGYLTPDAVDDLPWGTSGFKKLTSKVASEAGDARTYGFQEDGNIPWLNARLARMAKNRAVRENFPFVNRWGNGSGGDGAFLPLVGGPGEVKIPDCLAPMLGVVQRSVHITAYTQTGDEMLIWTQTRPASALHYPGKLDQASSGLVRMGESNTEAITRAIIDGIDGGRNLTYHVKPLKPVSYFTVGGDDACQLKGLAEAVVETSLAAKVEHDWVPRPHRDNYEAGQFSLLTIEEVRDSLLNGEWKPASALAMLRFLVDLGVLNKENTPDIEDIRGMLCRQLPHWMEEGTVPYA